MDLDIPPMRVEFPDDLRERIAKHVEHRLEQRLGNEPGRWASFAKWLAGNITVEGNAVTWPQSGAVERFGVTNKIDSKWIDEAVRQALKDCIKA